MSRRGGSRKKDIEAEVATHTAKIKLVYCTVVAELCATSCLPALVSGPVTDLQTSPRVLV
jgi:hypothetical protein